MGRTRMSQTMGQTMGQRIGLFPLPSGMQQNTFSTAWYAVGRWSIVFVRLARLNIGGMRYAMHQLLASEI